MSVYDADMEECLHHPSKMEKRSFTECSCGAFRCKRCETWRGPELGMADDAPALCDYCWHALGLGDEPVAVSP